VNKAWPWLIDNAKVANIDHHREAMGILLYFSWNIWKERKRCILDGVQPSEFHVAISTKEELDLYFLVNRHNLLLSGQQSPKSVEAG
jgi:hypothetical protein